MNGHFHIAFNLFWAGLLLCKQLHQLLCPLICLAFIQKECILFSLLLSSANVPLISSRYNNIVRAYTGIGNTNPKSQKNFQLINEWEQGCYEPCGHLCIILSLIVLLPWLLLHLPNLSFRRGSEGTLNAETILGHPHPARSTGREGLLGTAHYVSTLCCVLCNVFPSQPSVLTYRCLTDTLSLKLSRTWPASQSGAGYKTGVKPPRFA